MRRLMLALAALAVGAASLPAQKAQRIPPRPKLPAGGDTNSAMGYYRFAMAQLDADPGRASDALYWAIRLEPSWPQALYAYRVAKLRADGPMLVRYIQRDRKVRRELAPVDSLYFRALMQDPFIRKDLDRDLLYQYFRAAIEENIRRRGGTVDDAETKYAIEQYIDQLMRSGADDELRGWLAFSRGDLPTALQAYARAIGKKHENPDAHEERATIFYLQGNLDSARAELEHAIAELRVKDDKETVWVYQPKAMLEFKLGIVLSRLSDLPRAKTALGHSLEEDLSFYPAHIMLSNYALLEQDTATALRELDLAVELKANDPFPSMRQAELLLAVKDAAGAAKALDRVVAMEPYYATPHRLLGSIADSRGDGPGAIAHFTRYLQLTIAGDQNKDAVRKRISELGGQAPAGRP
ncbi:MAG TPA: tetratricopeptide repeat protein [Gemmatimonadales bacterium]|jgi:tetratricopeptide (TPR) repeat protein|nr:tetratricopeptide repeat protein [Gemmatimonadales bacterium]